MNKVFIVTSGEYSDYHIDGVYDDKGLAQAASETFGGEIEEWELNPFIPELRKGYLPFFVRMKRDGELLEIYIDRSSYGFTRHEESGLDMNRNMYTHVMALDEKHAIKIANERRVAMVALGNWETGE